jgi:hypothetical protein
MTGSATLKEFFISLGLDVDHDAFVKGAFAVNQIASAVREVVAVGKRALGVLPDLAGHVADVAHEAVLAAERTGLTTDAIQELNYAAATAGVGSEQMVHGLGHLARALNEAKTKGGEAATAFQSIGVDPTKLNNAQDAVNAVADAFAKMKQDDPRKQTAAIELFSRAGLELIPVLDQGSAGFAKLAAAAHEAGVVLDKDAIQKAEEYKQQLLVFHANVEGLKNSIGSELIPVFSEIVKGVLAWVRANRAWLQQKIHGFVTALRGALQFLANVLQFVIKYWKAFAIVIAGVVVGPFGALLAAIATLGSHFGTFGKILAGIAVAVAAFWFLAASPIALIVGMLVFIGLLIDDIVGGIEGKRSVVFELFEHFSKFLDDWLRPKPSDPWYLTFLKSMVYLVTHLEEAWHNFVDALLGESTEAMDALDPNGVFHTKKKTYADSASAEHFRRRNTSAEVNNALDAVNAAIAPAPVYIPAPPTIGETKFSVGAINVTVPAGAKPEEIGSHVTKALDEWTKTKMRETLAGVSQ